MQQQDDRIFQAIFRGDAARFPQEPGHLCPDDEDLTAFADGRLMPRRRSQVETHLARCGSCQEMVKIALTGPEIEPLPVAEREPEPERAAAPWTRLVTLFRPVQGLSLALGLASVLLIILWPARYLPVGPQPVGDQAAFDTRFLQAKGLLASGAYPEAQAGFTALLPQA